MNNQDLPKFIDELAGRLTPVKRIWQPKYRASVWVVVCLVMTTVLTMLTGPLRHGFLNQMLEYPRFSLEITLGLLSIALAAYYALSLSVPGWVDENSKEKFIGFIPFVFFTLLIIYDYFDPAIIPSWEGWRQNCENQILYFALVPLGLLIFLINRAIPLSKGWVGAYAGIAATTPAVIAMHIACAYSPGHVLIFHLLPAIGLTGLSVILARNIRGN